jgi:hypothetical protein
VDAILQAGQGTVHLRWSISGRTHHQKILGLLKTHEKKIFKTTSDGFDYVIGCPHGKVRYGGPTMSNADVNVRWPLEERTYKVSGTYGRLVFEQ